MSEIGSLLLYLAREWWRVINVDGHPAWTDSGYRVNDISEAPAASSAKTWVNEVSSLVYDPYGSLQERWKLFWHHYLRMTEDGEFQNGWIGYKSAATPEALRSAREVKLFAARAYNAANNDVQSNTYPPVGGPPVVPVHTLDKDLEMCVALIEPGAMATRSGLDVASDAREEVCSSGRRVYDRPHLMVVPAIGIVIHDDHRGAAPSGLPAAES